MTNKGFAGFPSQGSVAPDGSVTAGKLSAPQGWGILYPGRYYFTTSAGPITTSITLGIATLRASPWFVPNACTVSKLGAEIATAGEAGSKLRLGIYADDGTGYPGALVVDAGTIAGDSNTVQEISLSTALAPGLYWVAAAVQVVSVTQPTVRTVNAANGSFGIMNLGLGTSIPSSALSPVGFSVTSGATAAFPSPFPAGGSSTGSIPRTFVKVS